MISPRGPHVARMVRYIDRPLALLLVFDIVVTVAYAGFEQRWLALPDLPLSIGGGALGVILGFRINVSYGRWWEARTLWGRIVNYSRCVGRQAIAYISAVDQPQDRRMVRGIQRLIVYQQIAYVNSLRCQLRGEDPWPGLDPFLANDEIAQLRGEANAAAAIQRRMASLIKHSRDRGWLDGNELALLDGSLTELAGAQGGCERIKNTPVPRYYNTFIKSLVHGYCLFLPLGMVASVGLLTPVGSALLGFVFLGLENIGRDLEHPFDNSVHDIAMTSICRTIEIDLKRCLGEADLPAPIEPVRGVLW